MLGLPENIGMDHLPPNLLLGLIFVLRVVVAVEVVVQGPHEDHSHDPTEEEHVHEGADDGEPVDVGVSGIGGLQVMVPTRNPGHLFVLHPSHTVGPRNVFGGFVRGASDHRLCGVGLSVELLAWCTLRVDLRIFHGVGGNLKPNNPPTNEANRFVDLDSEGQMVVDSCGVSFITWCPKGVATTIEQAVGVAIPNIYLRHRKVVQDKMAPVLIINPLLQLPQTL
mmetsp:Transcript_81578/g.143836  ORF Transcript_81578/g.143836 Transcript_81578/m.143836 type:complete len:223 (+) Transcript_81578:2249-2917(+)